MYIKVCPKQWRAHPDEQLDDAGIALRAGQVQGGAVVGRVVDEVNVLLLAVGENGHHLHNVPLSHLTQ